MKRWGRDYGGTLAGFASMFVLWHVASVYVVGSALFPPPAAVLVRAGALLRDGTLLANTAVSLQRILTGFLAGSLLGIPIGLAMGSFAPVRRVLDPYTEFLRFIPAVAMITVAVIWFGIGEMSKLFLIIYATVFVVVVNHLKSKGCGRDADQAQGADADQHDGQGCWNPIRVDSVQRLQRWVASDPTHSGHAPTLLVGDFNAYAMEDPLHTLRAAGWQDAFALKPGAARPYSFNFDHLSGRLDHALLDAGLAARLRGAAEWHNNSDEAGAFNEERERDGDPWRASDHDPILLGFDLAGSAR